VEFRNFCSMNQLFELIFKHSVDKLSIGANSVIYTIYVKVKVAIVIIGIMFFHLCGLQIRLLICIIQYCKDYCIA